MQRRKDRKGRVLNNGEIQRKDGKYAYQYTDNAGTRKMIYSWKLVPSDTVPAGKRNGPSLREKEKKIKKDLDEGISPEGGGMTLMALVRQYTTRKKNLKYNTLHNYKCVTNALEEEIFSSKRIDLITLQDAKAWFREMEECGRGYSSMRQIHCVLRPAFKMAVENDLIRKNPFDFRLSSVVENTSKKRNAITESQENKLLEFIKNDECYSDRYEAAYILFNTGLRISEFCGLTPADVDFSEKKIRVERQLQRTSEMTLYIGETKTGSGKREIPMTDGVCECFEKIIGCRKNPDPDPIVDGVSGFLYFDSKGNPMVSSHWETFFHRAVGKYNRMHDEKIPNVTPHVCRHTFCSNMAKSGMNPKALQYIMGHSSVSVTLDTYTHIGFEDAKAEMDALKRD